MISVPRIKYGIRFEDVIFCPDPGNYKLKSLLAHFSQASSPLPGFNQRKTPIIDLKRELGEIFGQLSNSTRYKIRRAEREGVTARFISDPSGDDLTRFKKHFNEFAASKNLPAANENKLLNLSNVSSLIITEALDKNGDLVVSHAYIADQESARVRLLYSASHYRSTSDTEARNYVGRANRFLHWFAIQEAAKAGYNRYDLGGVPTTTNDQEKNSIARFKSEFGGEIVTEYSGYLSTHPIVKLSIPTIQKIFA